MFPNDDQLKALFTFETGDQPIDEEPPFHILLLGNWSGTSNPVSLSDRRPIMIDRDNFDAVIGKLRVNLRLDFGDLNNDFIELTFDELDDFHPDQLFRRLPVFAHLRDLRRRLSQSDSFDEAAREVRSWFQSPAASTTPVENSAPVPAGTAPDNLLDSILSSETTSASGARHQTDLDRLISQVVSPYIVRVDESEQSQLVAAVDQAVSELMRRILHHTDFRQLEAAWRGLYFLVRRVETDVDLKIYIVDLSESEMVDNLKSVNNLSESLLYRLLIRETIETPGGQPWTVIGGNYSFTLTVDHIATLIRLAKLSSAAGASFISHIRPEIFGLNSFAARSDSENLTISSTEQTIKLWSTLRGIPESNYLALSPMRFLVRLPYGKSSDSIETFDFEEHPELASLQQLTWANPCFAVIYLLALNYRRLGWAMDAPLELDITGLPFYLYQTDGDKKTAPCAETTLTEKDLNLILEAGLLPLVSFRDSDRVRVPRFQSVSSGNEPFEGRWKS